MEGCSKNGEASRQLLDLIPKEREWLMMGDGERSQRPLEEKKLELRLGPPGGEDWSMNVKETIKMSERDHHESLLSLGYFSSLTNKNNHNNNNNNNGFSFLQFPSIPTTSTIATATPHSLPVMAKESSKPCCTKVVDLQSAPEKKAFSSPSPAKNIAMPTSSQKRTAPAPLVGWPPIRSSRKNLANTSASKPLTESPNVVSNKGINEKPVEANRKSLFVKINMDGVPIGRKVDLTANDSYEKLSTAVDELFRGLLAAQRDSCAGGMVNKQEEEKAITGVLGGNGEYTLVYEDNEGDRMLVGDVPWHMFVSTVKRLRVLKSSEVSTLTLGSNKQDKLLARSCIETKKEFFL
ncbi:auxin-responsive protein IAA18-like [Pistacia vera]|uniref:auxin-responsive protein IAA18-like n=1 Tax=Pistacia vera TaxID=55513 RepID=UPI001263DD11|nr:auxin-responsive protein IAA18-like [Pistacia vera]